MNFRELCRIMDTAVGIDPSMLTVGGYYDVVSDFGDRVFRGMKYEGSSERMRFGAGGSRKSVEMACHVFESSDGSSVSVWDDDVVKYVYPYGTWYKESQRALEMVQRELGGRDVGDCKLRMDKSSNSGLKFSWNPRMGGARVCGYLNGERYVSSSHKATVEEARSLVKWIESAK